MPLSRHSYNRTCNDLSFIFNLQLHFVSMNTKYSNLSESLGHSDGLAVLGVFLKVNMFASSYNPFTPRLAFKDV